MKRMKLGDLEVFHLNAGETSFLHEEIIERATYLQHGIVIEPGACVLDVGANIGMFGIFLARRDPGLRYLAFEPVPAVMEVLAANMRLHGVDARLFPCALGSAEGEAELTYYPRNTLMSGRHADAAADRETTRLFMARKEEEAARAAGRPPRHPPNVDLLLDSLFKIERFRCPVRTLSSVIEECSIDRIDLLKIDVEKAERDVLAGIRETDWSKIKQIVVEVHDVAIAEMLSHRGYSIVVDQDPLMRDTGVSLVYART